MSAESDKPRAPDSENSHASENISEEQATEIVQSLLDNPEEWLYLAENLFPQYLLIILLQQSKIELAEVSHYTNQEFLHYLHGAIRPGRRCVELAYLFSKEPDVVEMFRQVYMAKIREQEKNAFQIQTRVAQVSHAIKITGNKGGAN
ncbi:hypothetical protein IT413_03115 [Candidatus Peregrinibacteria bacterium]|nr:hypothetical protein [Candidatus Peregrinibacteria bacterium]